MLTRLKKMLTKKGRVGREVEILTQILDEKIIEGPFIGVYSKRGLSRSEEQDVRVEYDRRIKTIKMLLLRYPVRYGDVERVCLSNGSFSYRVILPIGVVNFIIAERITPFIDNYMAGSIYIDRICIIDEAIDKIKKRRGNKDGTS